MLGRESPHLQEMEEFITVIYIKVSKHGPHICIAMRFEHRQSPNIDLSTYVSHSPCTFVDISVEKNEKIYFLLEKKRIKFWL